jgi:hypothetical protein
MCRSQTQDTQRALRKYVLRRQLHVVLVVLTDQISVVVSVKNVGEIKIELHICFVADIVLDSMRNGFAPESQILRDMA